MWDKTLFRWTFIVVLVAILFYLLYPKYEFGMDGAIRLNVITGQVDKTFKLLKRR